MGLWLINLSQDPWPVLTLTKNILNQILHLIAKLLLLVKSYWRPPGINRKFRTSKFITGSTISKYTVWNLNRTSKIRQIEHFPTWRSMVALKERILTLNQLPCISLYQRMRLLLLGTERRSKLKDPKSVLWSHYSKSSLIQPFTRLRLVRKWKLRTKTCPWM